MATGGVKWRPSREVQRRCATLQRSSMACDGNELPALREVAVGSAGFRACSLALPLCSHLSGRLSTNTRGQRTECSQRAE